MRTASVRVVLIDAEGPDFCAGADLEALAAMLDAASRTRSAAMPTCSASCSSLLRGLPKPVVAAVRGRAIAGGAGLATACDIVLAHEESRFGYPEVRVGFVPAMVMTMLRRTVGEKPAFELVATGRQVDAREALALGLVSRVFPAAAFEADVDKFVAALAATSANALRLTKKLFYSLDTRGFEAGISLGAQTNVESRATPDFREGVMRFARGKEGA